MTPQQEILDAAITSKSDARKLIQQAVSHFRTARRATIQVMADLRLLQDGEVHRLYGETNFSLWAEKTFEGLAAANVRQLTRAGAVALELERRGFIDLAKPEGIGTTGLRELSVIAGDFGNDKMAEIFKTAQEMVKDDGREVSATTVKAAMRLLMPPAPEEEQLENPEALKDDDDDGTDGYEEDKYPAKVRELIEHIQDLSYDLPATVEEIRESTERLQAELKGENTGSDEKWIASRR